MKKNTILQFWSKLENKEVFACFHGNSQSQCSNAFSFRLAKFIIHLSVNDLYS